MKKNDDETDDIPLTDLDYDGVVYEPSKDAIASKNKKIKKKQKIKKAQNFNFKFFIYSTIFIGIVVFGVAFFLVYSYIYKPLDVKPPVETHNNTENLIKKDANIVFDEKIFVGVIKNIDYEKGNFDILNFSEDITYNLQYKPSTLYYDKFEAPLVISEIEIGDVVECSFDEGKKINYIKESASEFAYKNVTGAKIVNNMLEYNNKLYDISPLVIVVNNGAQYDIEKIAPLDIITFKGNTNTVYYINIEKGMGNVLFKNVPELSNITVEIDRDIFKPLVNLDKINLAEGKHKIVIKSDNIVPYIKEIDIQTGVETVVDLVNLKRNEGTLIINANVEDYALFIDGKQTDINNSIKLSYGTHNLKFVKENYQNLESNVDINKPTNTITATLERIEKAGKLTISSNPENAEMFIDNAFVGYTPMTYKLPYGSHNITIKKDGYNDFVLSSVNISEDESKFNVSLHKKNDGKKENDE